MKFLKWGAAALALGLVPPAAPAQAETPATATPAASAATAEEQTRA